MGCVDLGLFNHQPVIVRRINGQIIARNARECGCDQRFGNVITAEIDEFYRMGDFRLIGIAKRRIIKVEDHVSFVDVFFDDRTGSVHDRPDKIPRTWLIRQKSDSRRTMALNALPDAPALRERVEAHPCQDVVHQTEIEGNGVPCLFYQNAAVLNFKV